MMGERTVAQEAPFCGFSLDRHVPAGHLLRSIGRFVDLSDIRERLRPFCGATGRPSIDPELMIRMLVIGYCMGTRSDDRGAGRRRGPAAWSGYPRIPVFDESARPDGTFHRDAFTYHHRDDSSVCPGGKRLRSRNHAFTTARSEADQDGFIRDRARRQDCTGCALRQCCTPDMPPRKVTRSIHEGARDLTRIAITDACVTSCRERKKLETLFAHLERVPSLTACACEAPTAPKTSSCSPLSPRISGNVPR